MLDSFHLLNKEIAYVENEGFNSSTLIFVLVFCFVFQLACLFIRSCFGHAMSKATQYATMMSKFARVFKGQLERSSITTTKDNYLKFKNLRREGRSKNLVLLLGCCQLDVENSNENTICVPSHFVVGNIKISKGYLHLLWMATSFYI
jgi:hypothetical protein